MPFGNYNTTVQIVQYSAGGNPAIDVQAGSNHQMIPIINIKPHDMDISHTVLNLPAYVLLLPPQVLGVLHHSSPRVTFRNG